MKIYCTISKFENDDNLNKLKAKIIELYKKGIRGIRINFDKLSEHSLLDFAIKINYLLSDLHFDDIEYIFDVPFPYKKPRYGEER